MKWRKPKGFESFRSSLVAEWSGTVLRIRPAERIDGVWRMTGRFQLFIGSEFVGTAPNLKAAKLALVLLAQERGPNESIYPVAS